MNTYKLIIGVGLAILSLICYAVNEYLLTLITALLAIYTVARSYNE